MFDLVTKDNVRDTTQLVLSELCMTEALLALMQFEETGSRKCFKDWDIKWHSQIEKWSNDKKEN